MINLLRFILNITPILSICFVLLLIVYKSYFKLRSRFNVLVNCWFCNQNTKVPYVQRNSWWCPDCEQYNGFTKDGDYNREIIEQLDCSSSSARRKTFNNVASLISYPYDDYGIVNTNGFCENCNENQRLKIEKLSQFEPKKESNFDYELKDFKSLIEKQYRLCPTCERHLGKVLREKKKMVLGTKLLDFIIKGADNLSKHPRLNILKKAKKTKLKTIIAVLLLVLAVINLFVINKDLTNIIRNELGKDIGDPLAHSILVITSHILAFIKLFQLYFAKIVQIEFIQKLYLFMRTLIFLSFNGMGVKQPKELFQGNTLGDIGIPFGSIFLAFFHSFLDGFRLTRYTMLLTIWSIYTGAITSKVFDEIKFLKLFTSIVVVILSVPQWKKNPTKISIDSTGNSFHKIYSDYLSDIDESSNFNNSMSSTRSYASSIHTQKSINPRIMTSSTLSLHKNSQISPFKRFTINDDQESSNSRFKPIQQFPKNCSLFASNLELNRPQTNISVHNQSFCYPYETNSIPTNAKNDWNRSFNSLLSPNFDVNYNIQKNNNIMPITAFAVPNSGHINSPFSYSSNSIYGGSVITNRSNLLSPSRFSATSNRFGSQSSWLSGGYFNNGQPQIKSPSIETKNCFHNNVTAPLTSENLSRASSQSSGFESHASSNQNNINNTLISNNISGRENSCCNDFDYFSTTCSTAASCDNYLFQTPAPSFSNFYKNYQHGSIDRLTDKTFKPIQQHNHVPFKQNALTQSISINCNGSNDGFDWRKKSNRDLTSKNSFNLNKINEELPLIQRGSLLKNWKDQQNCLSS